MDKRTRVLNAMNKKEVYHVPVGFWFQDVYKRQELCKRTCKILHNCCFNRAYTYSLSVPAEIF